MVASGVAPGVPRIVASEPAVGGIVCIAVASTEGCGLEIGIVTTGVLIPTGVFTGFIGEGVSCGTMVAVSTNVGVLDAITVPSGVVGDGVPTLVGVIVGVLLIAVLVGVTDGVGGGVPS
jgi:hypothetical protein